jgi:hypothetical protein
MATYIALPLFHTGFTWQLQCRMVSYEALLLPPVLTHLTQGVHGMPATCDWRRLPRVLAGPLTPHPVAASHTPLGCAAGNQLLRATCSCAFLGEPFSLGLQVLPPILCTLPD